jgi:hypothetical protein
MLAKDISEGKSRAGYWNEQAFDKLIFLEKVSQTGSFP